MGWKYKKMDIFEAVEIVKASSNEFVTQDVKIRNCVRAEDASYAVRQLLRALWLARAERAKAIYENYESYFDYLNMLELIKDDSWDGSKVDALHWLNSWQLVELKCREKAEEYR